MFRLDCCYSWITIEWTTWEGQPVVELVRRDMDNKIRDIIQTDTWKLAYKFARSFYRSEAKEFRKEMGLLCKR